MPLLDSCVNSTFEPGFIGASSGEEPVVVSPGSLYSPDSYPADTVTYSHDLSKFYNFAHLLQMGLF